VEHHSIMPFFVQPQQQPQPIATPNIANESPVRVEVAMDLIRLLSEKTMTRAAAAPNGLSVELIPGQKLATCETLALANACNCLSEYFTGRLSANDMEKVNLKAAKQSIEPPEANDDVMTGTAVYCLMCAELDAPSPLCRWCKGCGKITITPIRG
jgi:hypothetical protein